MAVLIATRAEGARQAAAQPKRRRRKPPKPAGRPVVKPLGLAVAVEPGPDRRSRAALAQLGDRLQLEPEVTRTRAELDSIGRLMTGVPGGR
jgi:hypothetical protein